METNNVKPLVMEIQELNKRLEDAINESHMPACVMDSIVLNIYNQIHMRAISEYQAAIEYEAKKGEEDATNNNDADSAEQNNA